MHRDYVVTHPEALMLFIRSVDWSSSNTISHALALLTTHWPQLGPYACLHLATYLMHVPVPCLYPFLLSQLRHLSPKEVRKSLIQWALVLKLHNPTHTSVNVLFEELVDWLLELAVVHTNRLGIPLYWLLKVESLDDTSKLYPLILDTFLNRLREVGGPAT